MLRIFRVRTMCPPLLTKDISAITAIHDVVVAAAAATQSTAAAAASVLEQQSLLLLLLLKAFWFMRNFWLPRLLPFFLCCRCILLLPLLFYDEMVIFGTMRLLSNFHTLNHECHWSFLEEEKESFL